MMINILYVLVRQNYFYCFNVFVMFYVHSEVAIFFQALLLHPHEETICIPHNIRSQSIGCLS